jgi:hypothetical protein
MTGCAAPYRMAARDVRSGHSLNRRNGVSFAMSQMARSFGMPLVIFRPGAERATRSQHRCGHSTTVEG